MADGHNVNTHVGRNDEGSNLLVSTCLFTYVPIHLMSDSVRIHGCLQVVDLPGVQACGGVYVLVPTVLFMS